MPASNFIQLFDFEGNLERGFRNWLAVQQIDARIGGAPETLGDDYIGAVVEIGATTEHAYDIGSGKLEYDQYAFTLNVDIRTRRHGDVQSETVGVNQRHRELVALVRTWLAVSQAKPDGNLNAHLPYNEIQFLRPSGTTYAAIEPDYDETTLSFAGQFSIKTDAWPDAMVVDAMVVEGAGESWANRVYRRDGVLNVKPLYLETDGEMIPTFYKISWEDSEAGQGLGWNISAGNSGLQPFYFSDEDVATPDLVTIWTVVNGATGPVPTVRRAVASDF